MLKYTNINIYYKILDKIDSNSEIKVKVILGMSFLILQGAGWSQRLNKWSDLTGYLEPVFEVGGKLG